MRLKKNQIIIIVTLAILLTIVILILAMPAKSTAPIKPVLVNTANNVANPSVDQSSLEDMQNQYKLLQLKRKLLDEELAIATSKEKIAELNAKTAELTGKADISSSTNNLTNTANMNVISEDNKENIQPAAPITTNEAHDYKLVYLDHQNDEWTATLNDNGQFEVVNVDTELDDGTKVITIDQSGVTLKHGKKIIKLSLPENEQNNVTDIAPNSAETSVGKNVDSEVPIIQNLPIKNTSENKSAKAIKNVNWGNF